MAASKEEYATAGNIGDKSYLRIPDKHTEIEYKRIVSRTAYRMGTKVSMQFFHVCVKKEVFPMLQITITHKVSKSHHPRQNIINPDPYAEL